MSRAQAASLYDARFEHDACGVGFVAQKSGRPERLMVEMALTALDRLAHRGAVAADGLSSDGAGVLTQIPLEVLLRDVTLSRPLRDGQPVGVAMMFLPPADRSRDGASAAGAFERPFERAVERAVVQQGLRVLGWRDVPIEADVLGSIARAGLPVIRQAFIQGDADQSDADQGDADQRAVDSDEATFEHRLYLARKALERESSEVYVCSMSCRTIVYKGLCSGGQLASFYPDLADPAYTSAFALFHQRYSTNTLPSWHLAQPLRLLAHNGEVNTLWSNRAWLDMRAAELPTELHPLYTDDGSDSVTLDEALELITRNGRRIAHALGMLIVPAWEDRVDTMSSKAVAFHRYHAALMEPWDGPAALAFADGRFVGAALDRNGLRPCRYEITRDGVVVAGSEVGLFDLPQDRIVRKGRLGPGQMLVVDIARSRILTNAMVRQQLVNGAQYEEWAGAKPLWSQHSSNDAASASAATSASDGLAPAELNARQHLFGFTAQDVRIVLTPMAEEGREASWSMGDDTPVAPLARSPRSPYVFVRQRFAQVTNPPIDPLRERCVMALRTWLGPRPPLFEKGPQSPVFELTTPILTQADWHALLEQEDLHVTELDCTFDPDSESLGAAVERLSSEAVRAVRAGTQLLMLSDRAATATRAPVPMLFAVGAVHHTLQRERLRGRTGLVAAAGDACDVHHVAALLGFGAAAAYPWLALATAQSLAADGAQKLQQALEHGLRKVLSRLGISTISSYRCGQTFEVLGFADEVVEFCFTGAPSRIGGIGWSELHDLVARRQSAAVAATPASASGASSGASSAASSGASSAASSAAAAKLVRLPDYGQIRFRRNDQAELHVWQPGTVRALQRAVAAPDVSAGASLAAIEDAWREFRQAAEATSEVNLRDLLDFEIANAALPRNAVESEQSIVTRFVVSAMSLGALSPEAHSALTLAMNRLGARSNSGEGGEDPDLYRDDGTGERRDNRIKQIASGRFGVTTEYLARADEIEIKIAQGAKPGEGGQLPGHKVTELIARLRHTRQGVPLISPPPHHDIYSIEDIAQLIFDLKAVNPRAAVGVKLVAQAGVGTVAAGVAKADADFVTIAGHSGGTGASPLSSIKHAGLPWELGLAETQQTLMRNGLRSRIRVRTDGGIASARDVVIAALLGADEFGFGTAPLVALGCDMARQCHLNTCPTGIATQRPDLRAKFTGTPEQVMRYFLRLAADVRDMLAMLGLDSVQAAVGRVDLLRQSRGSGGIDLTRLLVHEWGSGEPRSAGAADVAADRAADADASAGIADQRVAVVAAQRRGAAPADAVASDFWQHVTDAMAAGIPIDAVSAIGNHDRTVGARLAGQIALRHGGKGLPTGSVRLHFHGCAGQSFGAFAVPGMHLVLDGEANDYVGKGLSGGEIVLRPRGSARRAPDRHVILGNVALYGATSGRLFAAGMAGERFAVRNSGANAVVEGVGDHACEYMTGGMVVVIGATGRNFGAGMTGGIAYVFDRTGRFPHRINTESVFCSRPDAAELAMLKSLLCEYRQATGSRTAQQLVSRWKESGQLFRAVRSVIGRDVTVHADVAAIAAAAAGAAGAAGAAQGTGPAGPANMC